MIHLTENQWLTLVTVREQGPISVIDLHKVTGEPDTGERIRVERLERLGLVKRQIKGNKGTGTGRTRIKWVVTDEGKRTLTDALGRQ